jgi:Transposase DDE domain
VSALWTSDDVPSVVRLIRLRARLDAEGVAAAPVSLFGQVARLEDRLILTPQARRQAGIVLADDPRRAGGGAQRLAATVGTRARAAAARLIPRDSDRWRKLYRRRASVEREFGRLKHEWALLPLRVRGIERVQPHADLTILAKLSCALARARAMPLAA